MLCVSRLTLGKAFLPDQSISWLRMLTSTQSLVWIAHTGFHASAYQQANWKKFLGSSTPHQHQGLLGACWLPQRPVFFSRVVRPTHVGTFEHTPSIYWIQGCFLKMLHELGVLFRTLSDGTARGQSYRGDRPLDVLPRNHLHRWKGDKSNLVGAHPAPLPHSASHSGKASAFSLKSYVPGTRREGVLPLHYLAVTAAT